MKKFLESDFQFHFIVVAYASISVKPKGGEPQAYVGYLTFQKNF